MYHVSTLAGDGTLSIFNRPYGLSVDANGNAYVADFGANKIFNVTPAGVVTTIAGSGYAGAADGNGANAEFKGPTDVAISMATAIFMSQIISTIVSEKSALQRGHDSWATDAVGTQLRSPTGLDVDGAGTLFGCLPWHA